MPSTYTVNLGIEKPATGEQSGTWGDTTNVNFDIIDQAVNGSERVTLTSAGTSGSPNDLNIVNGSTTSSEGRNKWIEIYSASDLGGSAYVRLVPNDAEKILFIRNSLAGSQSVLLFQGTYNASNDLEIPAGVDMVVRFDGAGASATVTDVFTKLRATEITTPTLTAGTADINGGTIDGTVIGGSTPAAVTTSSLVATTADINAGTIDGTVIGGSTAAAVTGTTITGTSFVSSGDMTFGDDDKAIFGAGSDLQIYHTGADSRLVDSGTGTFYIAGTDIVFLDGTLAERYADFTFGGAARLFYDNAEKLATTATGIDVTGTVTADGLTTNTAGISNFIAGVNAGNSIIAGGNYNVVVGDEAGTAITTGDYNVAVGYNAGAAINTGAGNVGIGGLSLTCSYNRK
jgi:hypothetical protein